MQNKSKMKAENMYQNIIESMDQKESDIKVQTAASRRDRGG